VQGHPCAFSADGKQHNLKRFRNQQAWTEASPPSALFFLHVSHTPAQSCHRIPEHIGASDIQRAKMLAYFKYLKYQKLKG
jgi:hypothetical protein